MVRDLNDIIKEDFLNSKKKVDFIIRNEITDRSIIEGLLNNLIADSLIGYGDSEFEKLNKYYSGIDKKNSEIYSKLFEEVNGSD